MMNKKEYKELVKKETYKDSKKGLSNIFRKYVFASLNAVYLIRKYQYHNSNGRKLYAKYLQNKLIKKYGIFISANTRIGQGLALPHPNGIIFGDSVVIGNDCTIYQQVTIGSANKGDYKLGLQPQVGNHCMLFAGAKIIGKTKVSDYCIVGANAVVNKDTKENGVYAGVPAKLIKINK